MKKIIFILFFFALFTKSAHAQTPANDKNWSDSLTFLDDFKYANYTDFTHSTKFNQYTYCDGGSCDTSNYYHVSGLGLLNVIYGTLDGNNLIFNSAGKGVTTIVTKKGWYKPTGCSDSFDYTTTGFQGPTKMSGGAQKYGYWELRFRVPQAARNSYTDSAAGYDINFWLWGNTPSQKYYSELDMFEMNTWDNAFTGSPHYHLAADSLPNIQYNDIHSYSEGYYVYPSGHYPAGGWPNPPPAVHGGPNIDSTKGYFYPPVNFNQSPANDTGWHRIGMDWEPNYVKWYVDDTLAKFNNYDYSVFNDSMNLYIANYFPTRIKLNGTFDQSLPNTFPYKYEVDYVKTYKLITDCSNAYSACSFSASTYPWGVKKSIEFTGSSCSTDIASGNNVTLRAVNSVKLDKNFKVEKGATFIIIMQPCPD